MNILVGSAPKNESKISTLQPVITGPPNWLRPLDDESNASELTKKNSNLTPPELPDRIENLRKRGENPKIQYFATIDFADNESLQLGIQRIHTRFNQRRLNPPSTTNRHFEGSSGERTAVIKNMARCSLPSDSELMRNGDTPLPDCEPANKRPRLERRSTSRNKRSLS